MKNDTDFLIGLTSEVVAAYVEDNQLLQADLPNLIRSIFETLRTVGEEPAPPPDLTPAVPIKKSVTEDYIICLEDGARLRVLKRYLRTQFDMTPEQYREKWKLPHDYPMIAPSYSAMRSTMAKKIGLGRKAGPLKSGRKSAAPRTKAAV